MKSLSLNDVMIEKASKHDAILAGELIYMAGKELAFLLFGTDSDDTVISYYRELWTRTNNRFSHRYSYIAKVEGKPVAMMLCYPYKLIRKLIFPTVIQICQIIGLRFLWHIVTNIRMFVQFTIIKEADKDEFYICVLSVLPDYRGLRIGAKLLEYAKDLAVDKGLNKCALLVEASNVRGISFYERNGYTLVSSSEKPFPIVRMVSSF